LAGLRTLLKKNENVKLFAISIDPADVSKSFAEKIASDGKGAINFPFFQTLSIRLSTLTAFAIRLTRDRRFTAFRIRPFT